MIDCEHRFIHLMSGTTIKGKKFTLSKCIHCKLFDLEE